MRVARKPHLNLPPEARITTSRSGAGFFIYLAASVNPLPGQFGHFGH